LRVLVKTFAVLGSWLVCAAGPVALVVVLALVFGDDFGTPLFWGALSGVVGLVGGCAGVIVAFWVATATW